MVGWQIFPTLRCFNKIEYLFWRKDRLLIRSRRYTLIELNRESIDFESSNFETVLIKFSQKFSYILGKLKLTRYAVSKKLNVDAKSVSKWLTGKSLPETVNLIKLANLADLSVDELLGQE